MHGFFYKFLKISIIVLVAYGLVLGIIIPWAAPQFLPQLISQKAGIHTNFTQAKLNPFTFQLSLKNLEIFDQKGSTALGIKEFKVDFNPSSLFKKEVLIKSTKAINPRLYLIIDSNGQFNLANIIADSNSTQQKSDSPSLFHFSLKHGAIENGSISFTDASKKELFTTKLENLNYTIQDISTKPGTLGAQEFGANGALFEDIAWEGVISLEPFKLYGQIWLNGLPLAPWWDYLAPADASFSLLSANAWLSLPYRLFYENDTLHVALDKSWLELKNLNLSQGDNPFVSLGDFSLDARLFEVAFMDEITLKVDGLSLKSKGLHVSLPKEFPFQLSLEEIALDNIFASARADEYNVSLNSSNFEGFKGFMTSDSEPFAGFESMQLSGINIIPNSIKIGSFEANNPFLKTELNGHYSPDFLANITTTSTPEDNTTSPSWEIELGKFFINNASADIKTPIQSHGVEALHVKLHNIQYPQKQKIEYQMDAKIDDASIKSDGLLGYEPLDWSGNFELKHPNLIHYNPYLKPNFLGIINRGDLHVKGSGELMDGDWNIQGTLKVNDFMLQTPNDSNIAGIGALSIKQINTSANSLKINGISLAKAYLNVHIYETMETNFNTLFPKGEKSDEESNDSKETKFNLTLEDITLNDSIMDFTDDSLPLPFNVRIQDLGGEFSSFETQNTKPARVRLEGHVKPYGYAKVEGEMFPLDPAQKLNINLLFNNINMTRLSPYSGKFVGYAFKDGKLDLDLDYHIENSQLLGENSIILHDLTLGDVIESPDALNLPLQLAIALLKDSNGKIDMDLPVKGDLNDPKFAYGTLIFKAIGNLITVIVTSPFRFLGNILGMDGEELKSIQFEPGFATLLPPAIEKIKNYNTILTERPGISLKITPVYNQDADSNALKVAILKEQFEGSTGVAYGELLSILYVQAFSNEKLEKLRLAHSKEGKLNVRAFEEAMYEALVQIQRLEENALENLAKERAKAIHDALIEKGVSREHLKIAPISDGELMQDRWVESPMEIAL